MSGKEEDVPTETQEHPEDATQEDADSDVPVPPQEQSGGLRLEMLRHAAEGRAMYHKARWPAVLLWKLAGFRPENVSDKDWKYMMTQKLPDNEIVMMYGIMALWDRAEHYGEECFGRMHALFGLLSTNHEAFAKVLRSVPERLGIAPIDRDMLKFDARLVDAWDKFEKHEHIRRFVDWKKSQDSQTTADRP